ncbi:MAG TPA: HAMP domain-containing sensor histidine kinase [Nocardioidaceae bacterium]|nr:HAMP domain-containing sensor histidine kinase [Nocardioidaceae bacterium]
MSRDTWLVLAIAVGWSAAVGFIGVLVARTLRRRSIRWAAVLLTLVAVGGVVAGVVGTARAMFLSEHDLQVVVLVCLASGAVTAGFALWLGQRVVASAQTLRDAARRFGERGELVGTTEGPLEFDAVARELARSSDRLLEAAEREQLLESSRRELVAWVSHDLRTPLAQIRAMAEALEDGIAEDPSRYHAQMRSQVDRMVRMVDDLFELSRISSGALQLSQETLDLGDVVSEAIAGAAPVAEAKGVRIDGAVETGALVQGDASALARVVGNLVMNAVRHTPQDGVVEIRGRTDSGAVELVVADECGGIPDPELDRVFDVGWRGSHSRTPNSSTGAGLGLAIVRGLVEAHLGTVAVANAGEGCRFVVRLPG